MKARSLSVDEVVEYGRQVARGLAAAHAIGVIHRDIKPQNILLTKDASGHALVKIIDFGIAADHSGTQYTSASIFASIGYAAPEQLMKSGKDIDGRADLYALGATMYRMLCGRMPYEGETEPWPWLMRVQKSPPEAPITLRRDCPTWLSDALMKALAALPEHRPANAKEFHVLLSPPPAATILEPRNDQRKAQKFDDVRKPEALKTSVEPSADDEAALVWAKAVGAIGLIAIIVAVMVLRLFN
jgi:serine/threonine-protein kinase